MADDVATTALVYDASGAAAGATQFVDASNKIIDSAQQIQDALAKGAAGVDNFSKSTQRVSDSFSQQTRFLDTLARAYDPLSAAVKKAQSDLDRLNGIVQAGGANAATAASMISTATTRLISAQNAAASGGQLPQFFNASSTGFKNLANDAGAATHAFGLSGQGFRELQASGVNAFQALASGMSGWRVAQTEGAQVLGAFVQGGVLSFATIAAWVIPIGAVSATIAALAYTISQTDTALKDFGTRLQVGDVAGTAKQYDDLAHRLSALGVSTSQARTALLEFISTAGVSHTLPVADAVGQLAVYIQRLRPDLGDFATVFKLVTTAIAGGAEGIDKLGVTIGHELPAAIQTAMRETGNLRIGLADIADAVSAAAPPIKFWASIWNTIGTGWQDFAQKVADSSQTIIEGFGDVDKWIRASGASANKAITENITTAWTEATDTISSAWSGVVVFFTDTIPKAWAGLVKEIANSPGLTGGIDNLSAASASLAVMFSTTLPNAWKTFTAALSDLTFVKTIGDAFTSMFAGIESKIDSLTAKASTLPGLGSMLDKLTGRIEPAGPPMPLGFAPPGLGSGQLSTPTPVIVTGGALTSLLPAGALGQVMSGLIQTESSWNPLSKASTSSAAGLTQLTTGVQSETGVTNPYDPGQSIAGGTQYFVTQLNRFGDVLTALAAYNQGPNAVARSLAAGQGVPAAGVRYANTVFQNAGTTNAQANAALLTGMPLATGTVGNIGTPASALGQQFLNTQPAAVTQKQIDDAAENLKILQQTTDLEKLSAAQKAILADHIKNVAEATKLYTADQVDANGEISREAYVRQADALALQKQQNTLQLNSQLVDQANAGTLNTADAYRTSAVAGLQAAAAEKARAEALTTGATAAEQSARAQQILVQDSVAAISAGQQQIAAGKETLANNQALADAALKGRDAEQQAAIQIAANVQTHDAYNKALATGNQALIQRAAGLQAEAEAQIKANDQAVKAKELADAALNVQDQSEQLQLQLNLVGQTNGEIQKQLTMLQAVQQIKKDGVPLDNASAQALLAASAASADLKQKLADAQEGAQRLNSAVAGIADTISSSIGTSIQNAFDNKTTLDWGATLKNVLGQIANQIVQLALIRPAIGSVLSAIGFAGAAQQFGTFGSLLQSIGSIGGGGTAGTGTTGGGGSTLGTLGNAASLASSAKGLAGGGESSGGWFSGIGNWANTLGYSTGLTSLVPSQAAISTAAMWGGGGELAAQAGYQGAAGLGEGFLGTGLTSILGPLAAGIGVLGALIPMIAPGILKGSMNYASQANLSSTGQISLSGQNQQNSQIASGVLKGLQPLVQVLSQAGLQVPGVQATYGTKTGYQAIVAGDTTDIKGATTAQIAQHLLDVVIKLNPGFKSLADILGNIETLQPVLDDTSKSFDDLSTIFTNMQTTLKATQDAAMAAGLPIDELNQRFSQLGQAIINSQIDKLGISIGTFLANATNSVADFTTAFSSLSTSYQTAIAEANAANLSITGISDSFRGLAIQLQGPELQAAISGLNDSFKSLQPGQYAAALDQIGQVFNTIFAQAVQFNAAGSAIWNAQDTAKANLRTAFNSQMSDLILGFTDPAALAIKQEKAAGAARIADAKAIGANVALVSEYNKLSLQKVTEAAKNAAQAVQQLVDAINQLKGGALSGLSPGKQAEAAYTQFETTYRKASDRGSDPAAFAQLGALATAAVQAFQSAYGNTAQTEAHRQVILTQLQTALKGGAAGFKAGPDIMKQAADILASVLYPANAAPAFAAGTMSTPPGSILVGERGPELLFQRGGHSVVPLPPANQNRQDGGNVAVLAELRGLRTAFAAMGQNIVALNRQVQGGQIQAHDDAAEANQHLGTMKTSIVHAASAPMRRKV